VTNPSLPIRRDADGWRVAPGAANGPAVGNTWFGAQAFAMWCGGRLPTEGEIHAAASSGRVDLVGITEWCFDVQRGPRRPTTAVVTGGNSKPTGAAPAASQRDAKPLLMGGAGRGFRVSFPSAHVVRVGLPTVHVAAAPLGR
jgi:hypothetical protein